MILDFGYLCMEFLTLVKKIPKADEEIITDFHSFRPGGKAINSAIAAARMGAKVSIIGTIGSDIFGKTIIDTLKREGISHSGIATSEEPTGIIQTIKSEKNETLRFLNIGANIKTSYKLIPDRLLNIRTFVLSHDELPETETAELFKKAKQAKGRTMIYTKKTLQKDILGFADYVISPSAPFKNFSGCYFEPPTNNPLHNEIFCGILASCLQSNMPPDLAESFAKDALKHLRSEKDPAPYIGDLYAILPKIKSQSTS